MFCKPILEVRHRLFGKPGAVDGVFESRDEDIYALRKLAFERDFHDLLERTPYLKTVLTRIENNVVTAAWRSKSGQNDALVSNNRDNNAAERMNEVLHETVSPHPCITCRRGERGHGTETIRAPPPSWGDPPSHTLPS